MIAWKKKTSSYYRSNSRDEGIDSNVVVNRNRNSVQKDV